MTRQNDTDVNSSPLTFSDEPAGGVDAKTHIVKRRR